MATKIVLASDNHGDIDSINKVLNDNPQADYYLHCGDLCFNPEYARPFLAVKGNNDWDLDLEKEKILEIDNHRILMLHGHGYTNSIESLANKALDNKCDVLFFGHTHEYTDIEYFGIRMINPGSTLYNRDFSEACYAIIEIDDRGIITSKRVNL